MKKAAYSFPAELFPKRAVIEALAAPARTEYERELRSLALKGYANEDKPDKELEKFIRPTVPWGTWIGDETASRGCITLGTKSWLATPESAPAISKEYKELLQVFQEPRSLLHLVGSCAPISILYIAEDLEHVSLHEIRSAPTCELLLIVLAPGVSVLLTDDISVNQVYARSIIGMIQEGAQVTLTGDHSYGAEAYGLQHDRWYLGKDATLTSREVFTGGSQSWLRKEFMLAQGSELNYTWLSALKGEEQAALTTVQDHEGAASKSSVLVKTALSERSRSFYRGMIRINEQSSQAEADQQQRALMVSKDARVCAIPALEVATHNVQCAHGSAAGRFSEDELWYLRSRGLGIEQAQKVLLEGFFNEPFVSEASLRRLRERVFF
jgi:hypothetical protein